MLHRITGWVNAGALRALARQPAKGVAWERPGTRFAALSVGSRGFVNRQTLSEITAPSWMISSGSARDRALVGLTVESNPAATMAAMPAGGVRSRTAFESVGTVIQ